MWGFEGNDERVGATSNSKQLPGPFCTKNLSKPSAVEPGPNPHKSILAGVKLFLVLKWVEGLFEWRLLA